MLKCLRKGTILIKATLRVLIVEDEENILEILKAYLEKDGFNVKMATTGSIGWSLFRSWKPDLVILDLMLPDLTGEQICQLIRKESDIPILMLTAKSQKDDIVEGLSLGADDYVPKPFSPKEVLARVKALIRRSKADTVPLAEKMVFDGGKLVVDSNKHTVTLEGTPINLTPAEYNLLLSLCRYPGRAYTRSELLDKVMGQDSEGYERTIDAHIKNLRQKIEKDPKNLKYILTVFGTGYKFSEDTL